jgi:hypothetical protein
MTSSPSLMDRTEGWAAGCDWRARRAKRVPARSMLDFVAIVIFRLSR